MNYLTPSQLMQAAPAASRMSTIKDGLIDSSKFVQYVEKELGHRPVWAVQGKPHNDVRSKEKRKRLGRHLVVCANAIGNATLLLNSHTVRRKAWVGAGFFRSGEQPLLLIGVALPLQRWRGLGPAIEELERYRSLLAERRSAMVEHSMDPSTINQLAIRVSKAAYLPGHKAVSASELARVSAESLYAALFGMLGLVLQGNLQGADSPRRVKPVRGPDALMHAGNAIFNAGLEMLDDALPLPTYRKT